MNDLLVELNRLGAASANTEDVFVAAGRLFRSFDFLFNEGESELRKLELTCSLFDHLATECVNDIVLAARPRSSDNGVAESGIESVEASTTPILATNPIGDVRSSRSGS